MFRSGSGLLSAAVVLTFVMMGFAPNTAQATAGGQFQGRLVTEWLGDGRNMRLVDSFAYRSPDRETWEVPKGTVVNGASIPQFLWSFIGSPFGGKYRKASVIHDYFCEARNRDWRRVHRVFYEAMLDAGVERSKAWIMYQAVNRFGPRWEQQRQTCQRVNGKIDFSTCVRNAAPPESRKPAVTRANVRAFIDELKPNADPETLRSFERKVLSEVD